MTDCGSGFAARLSYDVEGRLVGLGDPRLVALTDAGGQPLTRDEIDAESLMVVGSDEVDVGFEGRRRDPRVRARLRRARRACCPRRKASASAAATGGSS